MTRNPKMLILLSLTALLLLASDATGEENAVEEDAVEEEVYRGTWTEKGYEVMGGWRIVRAGDGLAVVLDEAFATRRAPDLKIFLSPLPPEKVRDRNATEDALRVAELERFEGAQRYALPDDIDLARYRTLVLHCERYAKLWGVAELDGIPGDS